MVFQLILKDKSSLSSDLPVYHIFNNKCIFAVETLTCKGMWTGPAESQFQPFQNDEEEQSHLDYFGKLFIYYVVKRNMALQWGLFLNG